MNLSLRTVKFDLRSADESTDGLNIQGYATTFEDPYEVFDWQGRFFEQFDRGAFRESIAEGMPRMQFDHGRDFALGALPVGVWTRTREDKRGLWMEGRIHDTWLTEPLRAAIQTGGVDGMSIAFEVADSDETWTRSSGDDMPVRTIHRARLAEAGPVVWPANTATSVSARAKDLLSALRDPNVRADLARLTTMPTLDADTDPTIEDGTPTIDATETVDAGEERSITYDPELVRRYILANKRRAMFLDSLKGL